ncbi:ClC family H(+)/Cl(-) exchange transporter [Terrisporobacter sp.]
MERKVEKVDVMLNRLKNLKYRLIADSLIIGILVGLVIVAYRIMINNLMPIFISFYEKASNNYLLIPIVFLVLIGLGFIVGKMVKKEPMISGSGIPQVEGILTRNLKQNWLSVLFYKFVGGLICLAVGFSAGREGPSVQMGACIGEGVSEKTNKLDNEKKYLITSGSSAGLSAAFSAPISGVMFSLEETHKNFSPFVLLSAMIASVMADFVSKQYFGLRPSLYFSKLKPLPLRYYWALIILGIIIGISGVIFSSGILKTQDLYKKLNTSIEIKCIIPFVITGIIGLIFPIALGGGNELIMVLKDGHFTLLFLFILIVVKFLFTFVCFGSGTPGGIFFPLLALGALVGNFVGIIYSRYLGIPEIYLMNFIVLAMAGHFASIVKAPITGMLLILEMTGSLNQLLSLAVVVIISQLVSDILNSDPIYESLLGRILAKGINKYQGRVGKKTLMEISVQIYSKLDNKEIKDINWPNDCLVVSIYRGEKEILPKGDTKIYAGDLLVVMTNEEDYSIILEDISKMAVTV